MVPSAGDSLTGSPSTQGAPGPDLQPAEAAWPPLPPDVGRRTTWLRLRVGLVSTVVLLSGMLTLDFVLVFALPVPARIAALARADVLHFGPVAILAALLVAWVELRPVSRVVATVRVGLRPAEEERLRALRAARNFPVELSGAVLGVGTLGNVTTLLLDLQGRSPTVWHSLHVSIVAQCLVLPFAVVLFLHARRVLRSVVAGLVRPGDPLVGGLGLGRMVCWMEGWVGGFGYVWLSERASE